MPTQKDVANTQHQVILVSGIPGSGKSEYCRWLEREHGFLHLDFDQLLRGEGTKRKLLLVSMLKESPGSFLAAAGSRALPTVIDWGFPLESFWAVNMLKEAGVELWWFDGNRNTARVSFIRRARDEERLSDELLQNRIKEYDNQIRSIEQAWSVIKPLFRSHIVKTVKRGPIYMSPEHIFKRMFESTAV